MSARDALAGALALPAALSIAVGASAHLWSGTGAAGTLGRMADSLAPHLLALGLALSLLLAGVARGGAARGAAALLVLAALAGGAGLAWRQNAIAQPLARTQPPALEVLWFNLYAENATPAPVLARALLESGADVLVLGEAAPLLPALEDLQARYPHRLGCPRAVCDTLVLSRLPFVPGSAEMIRTSRPGRMAAFALDLPQGRLDLLAVHLPKPWFYGFYDVDLWHLLDRRARAPGPLLVLGDFNAAPWSRAQARIAREACLLAARGAPATWPARAGGLGVPIDQMLVGGGAALVSLEPWGAGLGSNHRGLRAGIALEAEGTPRGCP